MENNDIDNLYNKFQMISAISNFKEKENKEQIKNNFKFSLEIRKEAFRIMNKKIIITLLSITMLTGGLVFAKDIEKYVVNTFGLGKGIDDATKYGYIENVDSSYNKLNSNLIKENIIDDDGIILDDTASLKVDDFLIDEHNLSIDFSIKLDKKILDSIKTIDDETNISFPDLIVTDDNNKILFENVTKERFDNFVLDNDLNETYQKYSDNYYNSGVNYFINSISEDGSNVIISLKYNMYVGNGSYPKCKNINIDLNKIRFENNDNINTVLGNVKLFLEVPEKMQERKYEYYKVTSVSNKDFNVYGSKVTDTGFELGITINNVQKAKYPETLKLKDEKWQENYKGYYYDMNGNYCIGTPSANNREEFIWLYGSDEDYNEYKEYIKNEEVINTSSGIPEILKEDKLETQEGSYVLDSNGNRYDCTMNPGRKCNYKYNNNQFDYYETFEMIKNNATDKIKVVLSYRYVPVIIELEKIK